MKLTYEQKLKAYKDWKEKWKSPSQIAKELNICRWILMSTQKCTKTII